MPCRVLIVATSSSAKTIQWAKMLSMGKDLTRRCVYQTSALQSMGGPCLPCLHSVLSMLAFGERFYTTILSDTTSKAMSWTMRMRTKKQTRKRH